MAEFTKTELCSLRRIWETIEKDRTFKTFSTFVQWASSTGFRTNTALYKLDQSKPHGPKNSFWYYRNKELAEVKSPFCEGCTKTCPGNGGGCAAWEEYWVKNWNDNICRKPKTEELKPEEPTRRLCFRYEHPDLVREGKA